MTIFHLAAVFGGRQQLINFATAAMLLQMKKNEREMKYMA